MNKHKVIKLKEIASVVAGQSPKSEFYSNVGGVPFLQGNRTFGMKYPLIDTYTTKVTKLANKGDVLMSVRAPVGDLNIANSDLCIGRGLSAIKAKNNNQEFLFYALKYNVKNLLKQGSGTTYSSVNKDIINEFDLIVPKDENSWSDISKLLSEIDRKIELNSKINQELEEMAKTLYDYWFIQFDFPTSGGKPYKSSGGKMVWSEELKREIPEGWDVGSLDDIGTFTNGIACQKYRPTSEEFLPVIKIREMKDGITKNTEKVRVEIPEKVKVFSGDVLFSWSASLEVMIWSGSNSGLNQHIFKVTSDKYPKSYYYFELLNYLQHFKMVAELRKTTMGHITRDHLKHSKIAIPPNGLIKKIDQNLSVTLEKIVKAREENQKLTELRNWMLPMLMNGQVRVK